MGGMGAVGGDIEYLALEQILQVYEQQLERGRRMHVVRVVHDILVGLGSSRVSQPVRETASE